MKMLIGTTVWSPQIASREKLIEGHFDSLRAIKESCKEAVDILIINNEGPSVKIFNSARECAIDTYALYSPHTPQIGWARARNLMMREFMERKAYDLLAMADCDLIYDNPTWPLKALKIHESDPELKAYMVRFDKKPDTITRKLKTGTVVDIYSEWYGMTNVVTREVIETVGGYDHQLFPQAWGFHDCEWARRLKKGKMCLMDRYMDPIRTTGHYSSGKEYDEYYAEPRAEFIRQYNSTFLWAQTAIEAGTKPIYFPYAEEELPRAYRL